MGAGQVEVFGLDQAILNCCVPGSAAHPGNATFTHVAEQVLAWVEPLARAAAEDQPTVDPARRKLTDIGRYRFRRDGEYHAFQPLVIRALQKAAQTGSREDY